MIHRMVRQIETHSLSACVPQKVTTHFYAVSFTHSLYHTVSFKRQSNVVVAMLRCRNVEQRTCYTQHSTVFRTEKRGNCICLRLTRSNTIIQCMCRGRFIEKTRNPMVYAETAGFLLTLISWHSAVWRFSRNNSLGRPNGPVLFGLMLLRNHWEEKRPSFWRIHSEKMRWIDDKRTHFPIRRSERATDFYLNLFESK